MKFLIATLALVALAAGLGSALPTDKVDCSQFEAVLDDLGVAQAISPLSEKYKIAKTREEQENACKVAAEAIKTLKKYNNDCNSALTQQVFSAILRTRGQMIEENCKSDTPQFDHIFEAVRCIADLDVAKNAEIKTILMPQVLLDADIKDEKERLKRACCAVMDSKKFYMEATREKCAPFDKVYADYFDSYSSESLGLICPDVEKLEKDGECAKLTPLKLEGVTRRYQSFLNPILKVVKTLDH